LLQRYGHQSELAQGDLFSRGGVVSDYLFAKDRLFASLNLSDDEMALYDRVYHMLKPRTVTPDLVVYLQARTDVLLERIRKRGRPEEKPIRAEYVEEGRARLRAVFLRLCRGSAAHRERLGHRLRRQRGAPRRAHRGDQEYALGYEPLEPRMTGPLRERARAVVVLSALALVACAKSEDRPAPDGGGAEGGTTCQQIRLCVFSAPCADDACVQSCAARGSAEARVAFEALRACTAGACATDDVNCACREQCLADGVCLPEADGCQGTAPVDAVCDSFCA